MKATEFGSGQDVHAPLLQGQLPQTIFKMIANHPNTKAMILETPGKKEENKQDQIKEVYVLRQYVQDTIYSDHLLFKTIFDKINENELHGDDAKGSGQSVEPKIINLTDYFSRLRLEERENYQDPRKQEAIERMNKSKMDALMYKTNQILLRFSKSPFKSKTPPPTPTGIGNL